MKTLLKIIRTLLWLLLTPIWLFSILFWGIVLFHIALFEFILEGNIGTETQSLLRHNPIKGVAKFFKSVWGKNE